ncbi:MAG: type II toxin-antitoxin system HicB family antitoxin [Treponema sp.]|jgi:predicted RNase H-like HicB family nuclease|nr:type II toxin-antitoxin system HicB family antitoxin [Treponema sp.]
MEKLSQIAAEAEKPLINLSNTQTEYTYWQSKDGWFIGYLNIWPEHLTQGRNLKELEEMLADLYEFYKEENETIIEKKTGKLKITA